MSAEAKAVIVALREQFGPGTSNGISAILMHDALPDVFTVADWKDWFFKPTPAAFTQAVEMGIIEPVEGGGWRMAALGIKTREFAMAEYEGKNKCR